MRVIPGTADDVARRLDRGDLTCPCGGGLRRWGWARSRLVRTGDRRQWLRPRRARCTRCRRTHVLLPPSCLARRLDSVEVIGSALEAAARGRGARPIAAGLGLPPTTVRDWIRRFRRSGRAWPRWQRPGFSWRSVAWRTDGLLLAPSASTSSSGSHP